MNIFYKKWVVNCAFGELLGIGTAGFIAFIVNHWIGEPHNLLEKLTILLAMIIAGGIEGALLGYFQWKVLKERLPSLRAKTWIGNTVFVAMLGWFFGMLPSLFFIDTSQTSSEDTDLNSPITFALLCIGMGLTIGCIFGLFQWFALRKHVAKAYWWIYANALGWGLGLGWIYVAASLPDSNSSFLIIIVSGITGGLLAGISIGVITGIFLKKILIS